MKIIINKCYGGFGLSHKAIMLYAKLSGFKLYPFTEGRKADGTIDFNKSRPLTEQEVEKEFLVHYSKSPIKNAKYDEDSYFSGNDFERNDKILIKVVEQLGGEADGRHADLKIIKIPDKTEYTIEEYDGIEWIAEKHKTWG